MAKDFNEYLRDEIAADPALESELEQERLNADVATAIYAARKLAGLTQKQLADLTETHQAVISRLEDADYDGHSLSMLRRIARGLGKRLYVAFVDPIASPQAGDSSVEPVSAELGSEDEPQTLKLKVYQPDAMTRTYPVQTGSMSAIN